MEAVPNTSNVPLILILPDTEALPIKSVVPLTFSDPVIFSNPVRSNEALSEEVPSPSCITLFSTCSSC